MIKNRKLIVLVFGAVLVFLQATIPLAAAAGNASFKNLTIVARTCDIPTQGGLPPSLFVPWYKYLGDNASGTCKITLPTKTTDCSSGQSSCTDLTKTVTLIAIAIIELLTRISGLVAVGFVLYGSFQYISSQGQPENINKAKSTITNAIIGFVVVVLSIAAVQFLGRTIQ